MSSSGQRIRQKRLEQGLSQEKLAHEVGVSKNTVGRWEGQNVLPDGANLDQLALRLGTTADWILRGDRREAPTTPERPDPPHWAEFLEKYEHIDEFTQETLDDIKGFSARQLTVRSWLDFERIAETVRLARPSPTFEAKKAAREAKKRA